MVQLVRQNTCNSTYVRNPVRGTSFAFERKRPMVTNAQKSPACEQPLAELRLGRYELIRRLAIGGMAELFLARATGIAGFEKLVVLKRILPQHAQDARFIQMFLQEARLAATLHHSNIAQVYDVG